MADDPVPRRVHGSCGRIYYLCRTCSTKNSDSVSKTGSGKDVLLAETTNHLPLRVNTGGVIPVIFASSLLAFPQTLAYFADNKVIQDIVTQLSYGMPLYNLLYVWLIIFFCYFYTAIVFNPVQCCR